MSELTTDFTDFTDDHGRGKREREEGGKSEERRGKK